MKTAVFVLHFLIMVSCVKKYRIDIYEEMPLGSTLTKKILVQSDQIFQTQNNLILLYNASEDPAYYDPHLLFFNDKNALYAACYYASEKIDSIKENNIFGILNIERNRRKNRYRNDLPPNYALNLTPFQGMNGRFGNKIVEEIMLRDSGASVQLMVTESENRYILLGKNSKDVGLNFLKMFEAKDTITYRISDLLFDAERGIIQSRALNEKNELKNEFLLVKNAELMDDFFEKFWNKLNQK